VGAVGDFLLTDGRVFESDGDLDMAAQVHNTLPRRLSGVARLLLGRLQECNVGVRFLSVQKLHNGDSLKL